MLNTKTILLLVVTIFLVIGVVFIINNSNKQEVRIASEQVKEVEKSPEEKNRLRLFLCKQKCNENHTISEKNRNQCYLTCKG